MIRWLLPFTILVFTSCAHNKSDGHVFLEKKINALAQSLEHSCRHDQGEKAVSLLKVQNSDVRAENLSYLEIQNLNLKIAHTRNTLMTSIHKLKQSPYQSDPTSQVCLENLTLAQVALGYIHDYLGDVANWKEGIQITNKKRVHGTSYGVKKARRGPASIRRTRRTKRRVRYWQNKLGLPLTPVELHSLMR